MTFVEFASYLDRTERTSSRLEMTSILSELFRSLSKGEVEEAVYLSIGSLGPPFDSLDMNMSEKMILRVLSKAFNVNTNRVESLYKEMGDLGNVAEKLSKHATESEIGVCEIFNALVEVAEYTGSGSQQKKIDRLAEILAGLKGPAVRYVVRIPLKRLRLGFSDMTWLDAISWAVVGDKSARSLLERAYNVSADIGRVARVVKEDGLDGLSSIKITPGVPVRPAAANRLPDAKSIISKLGSVAVEPKMDGFRLQCHYDINGLNLRFVRKGEQNLFSNTVDLDTEKVRIYSRNLEDMTHMFPEITKAVSELGVDSIIFEGEAMAYDLESGEALPFQETIQRRRKHDIGAKSKEIPLKLFAFDLLYLDGKNYLERPYSERRSALERVVTHNGVLLATEMSVIEDAKTLQRYFYSKIEDGLEGIMAKRLDAPYAAGKRNNNWIKLKREEHGQLNDTLDCVVLGYKLGKGKRTSFGIGAFLVGVYDRKNDVFKTVSNVGTGLTDQQWVELRERLSQLSVSQKPAVYDVPEGLDQDVWVEPSLVVEILADEITVSPIHSAGFALRFPRLVRYREDKDAHDATSLVELKDMFKTQKKR